MDEMAVKITEIEQRGKSNTYRIEKLEESTAALNELTTSIKVMVTKQEYIAEKVDGLDTKVTEMECKPGKRWDMLVSVLISSVVAGVIGFMLAQIGM
jgi:t-SNARE complex subunit (syntaxin)